jgi:hypothetical protein
VIINGADRMWEYFSKRSTLVWSGPVPPGVSQVRLVSVFLPGECANQTPVVVVEVTGAAGNSVDSVCCRSSPSGSGAAGNSGWDTWTPCTESFAELKSLACPWTIKLKDTFGNALDIGEDGCIVQQVVHLMNGNTKVILEKEKEKDSGSHCAFANGCKILVRGGAGGGGSDAYAKVLYYDQSRDALEIEGTGCAALAQGAKILNMQAQATIVLAMSTSE